MSMKDETPRLPAQLLSNGYLLAQLHALLIAGSRPSLY